MNKHTMSDLHQMQTLPLSIKIRMTQRRIREWVDYYGMDEVYIAFSGGKDNIPQGCCGLSYRHQSPCESQTCQKNCQSD